MEWDLGSSQWVIRVLELFFGVGYLLSLINLYLHRKKFLPILENMSEFDLMHKRAKHIGLSLLPSMLYNASLGLLLITTIASITFGGKLHVFSNEPKFYFVIIFFVGLMFLGLRTMSLRPSKEHEAEVGEFRAENGIHYLVYKIDHKGKSETKAYFFFAFVIAINFLILII